MKPEIAEMSERYKTDTKMDTGKRGGGGWAAMLDEP